MDVHIDDGRAFLERSDKHWDRILLALPDSLTLVTGQSSVRLESYLFTQEAIESAKRAPRPRRRVLDVQLLPRVVAGGPLRGHVGARLRPAAVHRDARPGGEQQPRHPHRVGGSRGRAVPGSPPGRVATDARRARSGARRPPVPLPAGADAAPVLRGDDRPDPAHDARRGARGGRADPADDAVHRPVLHGRGVPAAGDQERGAVRPAVRHHLVRQRARVPGRAPERAVRGHGVQTRDVQAPGAAVRPAAGGPRGRLGRARRARCSSCRSCPGSSRR